MAEIASDEVLEEAYRWLCRRRAKYSEESDVWQLRRRWQKAKPRLRQRLLVGSYRFDPVRELERGGERLEVWSAEDALVLKAIAIVLGRFLDCRLSRRCHHLAGRGGAKRALRATLRGLDRGSWVFQTDVRKYYASIDHRLLCRSLRRAGIEPAVVDLIRASCERLVDRDGVYRQVRRGIARSSPLAPLLAAVYLAPLDDAVERLGLFYARFMDDWVILAPNRWKLRRTVKIVNETLGVLRLEKAPEKTFIGRVERGFDFLGYRLSPGRLEVAERAKEQYRQRLGRLYEQDACPERMDSYVVRWRRWARSGLGPWGELLRFEEAAVTGPESG